MFIGVLNFEEINVKFVGRRRRRVDGMRDEFKSVSLTLLTRNHAIQNALVDRILAAKRAGDAATVAALEAEIDTHVFRLYGLTPEEVALIQGNAA